MWAIFQEFGNSPVVMHLLRSLDNHSDTMQLAIFKNLDGMSLGELFDFILRFLMRSWISYASVGARKIEIFEFICVIKCLSVVGHGFIFVERDFPTSEKKLLKSSHCFWHSESSKSLFFVGIFFIAIISLTSFHVFLYHDGIFGKLVYNNFVWRFLLSE